MAKKKEEPVASETEVEDCAKRSYKGLDEALMPVFEKYGSDKKAFMVVAERCVDRKQAEDWYNRKTKGQKVKKDGIVDCPDMSNVDNCD